MSARLRLRASRERAARNVVCALRGVTATLTFPFRRPGMWLLCRYLDVFFRLYYGGRTDAAFRFARLWPSQVPVLLDALQKNGQRVPGVLA